MHCPSRDAARAVRHSSRVDSGSVNAYTSQCFPGERYIQVSERWNRRDGPKVILDSGTSSGKGQIPSRVMHSRIDMTDYSNLPPSSGPLSS